MKKEKDNIKGKTEKELNEMLDGLVKEIQDSVSEVLKGKEKNFSKIRALRRKAASVKTILREKQFLKGQEDA